MSKEAEIVVGKSKINVCKQSFDEIYNLKKETDNGVYIDELEDDGEASPEDIYLPDNCDVSITKMKDDEQLVFGWANVCIQEDGSLPLDWQGDITAPRILEKAAYNFVLNYRATGEMHQGNVKGYLVESVMFTKEKMVAMGIPDGVVPEGWWIGFYIPDAEVFAKVKSGEYKMFSIQGKAKRLKV